MAKRGGGGNRAAALRAMTGIEAVLGAETANLRRLEDDRGARERAALFAYLEGVEEAGANLVRLPVGAGLLFGEQERTVRKRLPRQPSGAPISAIAGLDDIVTAAVNRPFETLRPPYTNSWTWTKYIHYAPGELSAYAHKATGKFGFDIASSHDSHQVNKSRARAAIGGLFRPTEAGVLGIRPKVDDEEYYYISWNMRVAHAYAWTGILVQSFDAATDELVGTPVDKKRVEFNKSGGGGSPGIEDLIPPTDVDLSWPPNDFWGTSLFVFPHRWYAIWIWCGGGIRAAGWQTYLGSNVGSDATSRLDVTVPSIALYFTPLDELLSVRLGRPGRNRSARPKRG